MSSPELGIEEWKLKTAQTAMENGIYFDLDDEKSYTTIVGDFTVVEYTLVGESMGFRTRTDSNGVDHDFGYMCRIGLFSTEGYVEILFLQDGRTWLNTAPTDSDHMQTRGFVEPCQALEYIDSVSGL